MKNLNVGLEDFIRELGEPLKIHQYENGQKVAVFLINDTIVYEEMVTSNTLKKWMYNHESGEHMLLIVREYYEEYEDQFNYLGIEEYLKYYEKGITLQKSTKTLSYTFLGAVLALVILFSILFHEDFSVWLIILIGVILGILSLFLLGVRFKKKNDKDFVRYQNKASENNPDLQNKLKNEQAFIDQFVDEYFENKYENDQKELEDFDTNHLIEKEDSQEEEK